VDASQDPDQATAQTIAIMSDHIQKGATDELVAAAASEALAQFGVLAFGLAGQDERAAESCWWSAKNNIRFVHHEFLLRRYLGEAGHLQGLIAPDVLVRMEKPEGDCAIYTMMICAMLKTLGVPYEIVTAKCSPRDRREYSHVYPRAVMRDGRRVPLDASHGDYPGWQVPSRDINFAQNQTGSPAVQVWDESGNPIADRGSRFDGLHNYGLRGGMGAPGDCIETDPYDGTCLAYEPMPTGGACPGSPGCPGYVAPVSPDYRYTGPPPVAPTLVAPSQSSAQWASFATQLMKNGFTLAEINAIQPGTVVGPGGQILRQATGLPVPVGNPLTTAFGTPSSSTLLMGGLALAGVLLFTGMKK
jgi:hypothetical protein